MARAGKHGIKLLTNNFSEYRRYGNAVIEVNDLKREDLIKLQRKGFLMFYLTPARIWYNFKRVGFKAFFKNAFAFIKSVIFLKGARKHKNIIAGILLDKHNTYPDNDLIKRGSR